MHLDTLSLTENVREKSAGVSRSERGAVKTMRIQRGDLFATYQHTHPILIFNFRTPDTQIVISFELNDYCCLQLRKGIHLVGCHARPRGLVCCP